MHMFKLFIGILTYTIAAIEVIISVKEASKGNYAKAAYNLAWAILLVC